jgi:hypothetical protein
MNMRYWKFGLLAIIAAGAALLTLKLEDREPAPSASRIPPSAPAPADSSLALPKRPGLTEYRFTPQDAAPKKAPAAPAAALEPAMPPLPYRFAGTIGQQVLLAKDTAIFAVAPGEVLDELYRVDAIDERAVFLTYLPLGRTVVIELKH